MWPRVFLGGAGIAVALVIPACGYPSFSFGTGGASSATSSTAVSSSASVGGAGGSTASSSSSNGSSVSSSATGIGGASSSSSSGANGGAVSSSSSAQSSSSSSSSSGSGGSPTCAPHLFIVEFQTRGENGAYDEFVSLYNPTSKAIVLTSAWSLQGRGDLDTMDSPRWTGSSAGVIPAFGYFLIAGGKYSGGPKPDASFAATITDAGRLNLVQNGTVVDSVCFAYDTETMMNVEAFTCPGMPAMNPHNDSPSSDSDTSLARTPLSCTDTGDSDHDFGPQASTPRNTSSAITEYP